MKINESKMNKKIYNYLFAVAGNGMKIKENHTDKGER